MLCINLKLITYYIFIEVSEVNKALKGPLYVSPGQRPGYADNRIFRPERAKE